MPKQGENYIYHKISSRFMTTEKQHHALCEQFLFRQNVAVFLNVQQQADQVVTLLLSALRDLAAEELRDFKNGILRRTQALWSVMGIPNKNGNCVCPLKELVVHCIRNPKHLGNYEHGKRIGDVLQNVRFGATVSVCQEMINNGLH